MAYTRHGLIGEIKKIFFKIKGRVIKKSSVFSGIIILESIEISI